MLVAIGELYETSAPLQSVRKRETLGAQSEIDSRHLGSLKRKNGGMNDDGSPSQLQRKQAQKLAVS